MQTKKSLRQEMRSRLAGQSLEDRNSKSLKIGKKLFELDAFKKARTVCLFVATSAEVDTGPMIDEAVMRGKRMLVPLADLEKKELVLYEIRDRREDLRPGTLGILEPIPEKTRKAAVAEVECAVIPGLAFDRQNHRLGRGAGFYDRFLEKLGRSAFRVGVAFSFQVLPEIPHENHDQLMDLVLTEE